MSKNKSNNLLKRNYDVILIIVIHLLITIPLALLLNTWYDESISLNTSSGDIANTIKHTLIYEWQPPVYFVLLTIWRNIENSYFFARLLSIIFSSASILVSHKFLKKHLNIDKPAIVSLLIALNPFLVYYALEIRLYTMVVFLSSALIYLMFEIYLKENKSKLYRILFILLSIISIHTQYYMAFLILGIGLSVLIYEGWNKFKIFMVDMIFPIISLIGVIPYLEAISNQSSFHSESIYLSIISITNFFITRINSYLYALQSSSLGFYSKYENVFFIIIIISIFLFSIKSKLKEFISIITFKKNSTLPIIIVLLLFFIFVIIKYGRGPLTIRHTSILFIPLIYFVIQLIYLTQKRKILLFWFFLVLFLYSSALLNKFSFPLAKEGDGIRIAKYLESHEKDNELILVPYNIIGMPLKVHYKGRNSIISLYDSLLTEESRAGLLKAINGKSGFWCDFPNPFPTWHVILKQINMSDKFIKDNFTVIDKKYFKGMELSYLKRKE